MSIKQIASLLAAATALCFSANALAQDPGYPNRPIRLIVPYAAGGGTDILARQLSKGAADILGQAIIVDNKPGAGTSLGAVEAAKAAPDGYTLLWGDNATFAVNPHMYKKLAYDPVTSFAPVTLTVKGSLVLVAGNKLNVKTVGELITLARSQPGKLSYGTPGNATPHHLAMETLKQRAGGLSISHIPYKGEAPAMQDLLGGNLDLMFAGSRIAKPQAEAGKIAVLGVSGAKRNATMPQVMTVAESGLKGYVYEYWHGIVAPAKTPPEVIARINQAFVKAMHASELVQWINNSGSGSEWTGSTPTEMQAHIARELQTSGELVKAIGLTID